MYWLYVFLDINECTAGTDMCHDNAMCTNTAGSYECSCDIGFTGDGIDCTSMNFTCTIMCVHRLSLY